MERIVLAYSGSARASRALEWLVAHEAADIVAVTLDLGQGRDLDGVRGRAVQLGAARAHVLDARDVFAREYVWRAMQAGAFDEGRDGLMAALPASLLAQRLVDLARIEGASAIAHACPSPSAAATRIEAAIRAIDPSIDLIAVARRAGFGKNAADDDVRVTSYVGARTLSGPAIESALSSEAPIAEDLFDRTKSAAEALDTPATVEVTFDRGMPVAVNGIAMSLTEAIESLETIAGAHGVGRLEVGGTRRAGAVERAVVEAPALIVLRVAARAIETSVSPRDLLKLSGTIGRAYGEIVDHARWRSTTKDAIDAFVLRVQQSVSGTVRVQLQKGECQVIGPVDAAPVEIEGAVSAVPGARA